MYASVYIAYIACGSALLYIKPLYFFLYFGAVRGGYRRKHKDMMRKLPNSLYLGHASYVCSTVQANLKKQT